MAAKVSEPGSSCVFTSTGSGMAAHCSRVCMRSACGSVKRGGKRWSRHQSPYRSETIERKYALPDRGYEANQKSMSDSKRLRIS